MTDSAWMPPLQFATTNGIRMGYYEAGPASDRPPLILCHGWPELAFSWRHQIRALAEAGIRVSLFIDPDRAVLDAAGALGVPAVELHTGRYAGAAAGDAGPLEELHVAAAHGLSLGLAVHAGHGLTYTNVGRVAAIPAVEELNIGHSIVSRALLVGFGAAVAEMAALVRDAPSA